MWTPMSYMVKFKLFIVFIDVMFSIFGKKKADFLLPGKSLLQYITGIKNQYPLMASMPGNIRPSMASNKAPPPVET
jgi:hypothetical protein